MTGFAFDPKEAQARLLRFLAVEGITGHEEAIAQEVVQALVEDGVPRRAIRFDNAHKQIPLPTPVGNLIVQLPGTRPGPRRLFMTHLDTVPLCAGAKPVRQKGKIVPAGPTARRSTAAPARLVMHGLESPFAPLGHRFSGLRQEHDPRQSRVRAPGGRPAPRGAPCRRMS